MITIERTKKNLSCCLDDSLDAITPARKMVSLKSVLLSIKRAVACAPDSGEPSPKAQSHFDSLFMMNELYDDADLRPDDREVDDLVEQIADLVALEWSHRIRTECPSRAYYSPKKNH